MTNTKLFRLAPLVFVIFIGTVLRFYNLNWDDGYLYHPDEMNMAFAMAKIQLFDHLDPGFYAYNGFSLYLYKLVAAAVAFVPVDARWANNMGHMLLVGRSISALVSSLSLGLIYCLGIRIAGARAAFLATSLAAFNVGLIQCAHFAVTESLLVFFLLLTALCAEACVCKQSRLREFLLFIVLGLAIGTKTSALSFLLFPLVIFAVKIRGWRDMPTLVWRAIPLLVCLAVIVFVVSPYSIINIKAFLASMAYEGGVVHGSVRVPYTLQFCDTVPYLPWLQSLFWLCTPPVAIVGLVGMCVWLFSSLKTCIYNRQVAATPILLFGLAYGVYIGSWHTKFVRYLVPLLPVIVLCAAWAVETIRKRFPRMATVFVFILLGATVLWSASFFSIYTRPSSRTAASTWMYNTVRPGSHLLLEHYDYQLPTPLPGKSLMNCTRQVFPFYAPDTLEKMHDLGQALASADLVILASRRLCTTIPKDSIQYPFTSRYYTDLFAGNFGFRPVAVFSSPPGIGSCIISDDTAEETFQVFDHPTIRIFEKQHDQIPPSGTSPSEIAAFLTRPLSDSVNSGNHGVKN